MSNRMLLEQSRMGIDEHIKQSPYSAIILRKKLIPDGFGGECEDPTDDGWNIFIVGRLSRESRMVQAIQSMSGGNALDSSATMYFLTKWDSGIKEGDQFPGWRVGLVTPLVKFEGIQAIEAALYPA